MSNQFPTYDQAGAYLKDADDRFTQLRVAFIADDPHKVANEIDGVLAALHQLREAAVGECRRRSDELMSRLDARYGPINPNSPAQ